jgi:very-short-patch-repair endonuclease
MQGENAGKTGRARKLRRAQTDAEQKLWYRLDNRQLAGWKFVRQEPIGPYFADFACREARLIVEVDGSQHVESERDVVRDAFLSAHSYRVLRFWNHDALWNMQSVLDTILAMLGGEDSSSRVRGEDLGPFVGSEVSEAQRSGGDRASQDETLPDTPPHPVGSADSASPRTAGRGGRA